MSDLKDAARQALVAMDKATRYMSDSDHRKLNEAIDVLKSALEQPEQEPVAWMVYTEDGKSAYVTDNPHDLVGAYKAFALYTHPPRREWRGLTEEEREKATGWSVEHIETKLKELNHDV
jgi:hypothetical protein